MAGSQIISNWFDNKEQASLPLVFFNFDLELPEAHSIQVVRSSKPGLSGVSGTKSG